NRDNADASFGQEDRVGARATADIQDALARPEDPGVVSMQHAAHPGVALDLGVIPGRDGVVREGALGQAGERLPRDNVHTHTLQIGFVVTSRSRRKATASGEFRMSSRGCSWILPRLLWKKHGRTVPSASTTDDTQGALHTVSGNSPSPFK